mgnify:FL=1
MKIETKCVHAGGYFDPLTGGINTPIFTSTVYDYIDRDANIYPRYFNTPNQEAVSQKLSALEGGESAVLFSSGMAAISTVMLSFLKAGDHAVIQDELYGGTHAFITSHFEDLGIAYSLAALKAEKIAEALTPKTRIIYIETPTNPLLNIIDIQEISRIAKNAGAITVIDNTFASPINQTPIVLGIDVVTHSGTKYLGGHSDLSCGAVITSTRLAERIRKTALSLGGNMNAHTCYLLERSLMTLALRVERQTQNAGVIAEHLENNPNINRVNYPGLKNHPGHAIAARQMTGFGAMLSFEIDPGLMNAKDFMRRLRLIKPGLSLGGVETTVCDPATTSHAKVSSEVRKRIGISDNLIRMSVGIEHSEDLIEDIEQALLI